MVQGTLRFYCVSSHWLLISWVWVRTATLGRQHKLAGSHQNLKVRRQTQQTETCLIFSWNVNILCNIYRHKYTFCLVSWGWFRRERRHVGSEIAEYCIWMRSIWNHVEIRQAEFLLWVDSTVGSGELKTCGLFGVPKRTLPSVCGQILSFQCAKKCVKRLSYT